MPDALTDRLRAVASEWRDMAERERQDALEADNKGPNEVSDLLIQSSLTRRACAKEIEDMIEGEG